MNIGLYPVGAAARYYTLNAIKTPDGQSITGVVKEQDVVPSFRQAVEGNSSVTESPPTARATWRGLAGSFGLLKQSDAPGDLTRPYLTDMDNTRPGQLTAWLRFGGTGLVAVDTDDGVHSPVAIAALVNAASAWGFVTLRVGAPTVNAYYSWNGTKFAFQRAAGSVPAGSWGQSSRVPAGNLIYANSTSTPAPTIVQQTGTNLWMPTVGGSMDLSVAAAAGVGVANAYHNFVYFDILFSVAIAGGNITITPYRPNTPGAGNILQSSTLAGFANALLTIPGEVTVMGVAPCEGAVYLCTDKSVYAIQWNDNNNTFLCTKLFELPRITGAPVVWNGEVFIPADGRIAHIVPNQRGYDWRTPDAAGVMPAPYNGMITQLLAFSDRLVAQVTDPYGTGGNCVLLMDANGVWSCLWHQVTTWSGSTANAASGPMVPIVDGLNPQAVAFPNWIGTTSNFSTMVALPIPQTNKNPRTLATTQRIQRPGPFRLVTPWIDLEAEGAQKLLQRFAQMILDASASFPITADYQTDFLDEAGANTYSSGCAANTGTWHKCFYAAANSTAYAGSTDSGGRGQLWFEFDGSTNYTGGSVGVLARYPTYKRVRFLLTVNGDTTGATVPTILTTFFDRVEFMTKAFQRQYVIVLDQGDLGGYSPAYGGTTAVSLPNSAAVVAEYNTLKGYDGGKTELTEVNEKGETRTVLLTKFDGSPTQLNPDGTPAAYVCTLTVLDAALTGLT